MQAHVLAHTQPWRQHRRTLENSKPTGERLKDTGREKYHVQENIREFRELQERKDASQKNMEWQNFKAVKAVQLTFHLKIIINFRN